MAKVCVTAFKAMGKGTQGNRKASLEQIYPMHENSGIDDGRNYFEIFIKF